MLNQYISNAVATGWLSFYLAGCADSEGSLFPNQTTVDSAIFSDMTGSHLPTTLSGLSMDAAVADLDGDGDLDIIIANEFNPNIFLMNEGNGQFVDVSNQRLPRTNHDSEDVGIADFDGDGDLDIVIVSEDDHLNELYLNDGAANFVDASTRIPVTGVSNAVIVHDINNDGYSDIFIGNNGQNNILLNDGAANFSDHTSQRLPAMADITQDLELGDVDGDGDLDILVGNEDRNRLLINTGDGFFSDESQQRIPLRSTPEETREADFGDIDGDGDIDIFFANTVAFVGNATRPNRLLVNDGTGHFSDVSGLQIPLDNDRTWDADFLDIDDDGDLDIITGNSNFQNQLTPYRVYQNNGVGNFIDKTNSILPGSAVGRGFDIEAADFNNDGKIDMFLASRGSADRLLLAK